MKSHFLQSKKPSQELGWQGWYILLARLPTLHGHELVDVAKLNQPTVLWAIALTCANTGSHLWCICFSVQKTYYTPCYGELDLKTVRCAVFFPLSFVLQEGLILGRSLQNFANLSTLRVNLLPDTTVEHRRHFIEQLRPAFQKFERLVSLEISASKVAVHLKRFACLSSLSVSRHLGMCWYWVNMQAWSLYSWTLRRNACSNHIYQIAAR